MMIGVQLFGCMKLYNEDPEGLLAKLAQAGFTQAEPCIFFGEAPQEIPFAWKASDLALHKGRLDRYGLSLSSCHAFAADLDAALPQMIEAAEQFGIRQYVIGFRGEVNKENLTSFRDQCVRISDALAAHQVELWLHNGSADLVGEKIDGVSAALWLLQACGGKLGMQVDTGWVVCAGVDLQAFMTAAAPYIRSVHHKDLREIPADGHSFTNVAVGKGVVDSAFAADFGRAHNLGQIVDQDNSAGDMLQDLAESAAFLQQREA